MAENYDLPHLGGKLMSTQVSLLLMRELRDGVFSHVDKLPSEVELAERLGVSRTVIRDALSDIEREGFVERVRGIGTVVCREIVSLRHRFDLKLEYYELVLSTGRTPHADSIRLYTQPACAQTAALLKLEPGEPMIVCEKRVLADDIPCIFSVDFIPETLFRDVEYHNIDWAQPVFDILDKYCGLVVLTSISKITAVMGDADVREKLAAGPDSALLRLDEIGYCKLSRPVMRSFEYYTDFFDFTMLRKKF